MKIFYRAAAFTCIFLILYACNRHVASYELYVNADLDESSSTIKGKRVLVYTKKETGNLILEVETVEKIKKALAAYGYIPADNLSNADYVLLFEYSIDTGKAISSRESGYTPTPFTNRFESSRSTNTETEYIKELTLRLFSAEKLSKTSQPLWTGKAYIRDTSFNLRKAMDYLIVAAFEHFGKETGEDTMLIINSEDKRIKGLNQAVHQ
ncbi:MAG: hypothetical protein Q7U10_11940 [Thermodesulfovibrionia bacterium]|nr:hypothetical protein [Thermodesulfovibrionia bacterium]